MAVWKKYDSSLERNLKSSRVISISKDLKKRKSNVNASREMLSMVAGCRFAAKDVARAQLLLQHLDMSASDKLVSPPAGSGLIGMDNWLNVTCYLDCLVFVMFAKLTEYDDLLYHQPLSSEDSNELRFLMRLVVNLLRSEEHITTDIMQLLCHSLMTLGFPEAVSQKQQDPLMLFEFITQALGLPLLTLKIDIIHSGQVNIDDDLKYIQERCLLIPVTEEEEQMDVTRRQEPVALEACLNQYFNNSVTVKRHLQRRKTLQNLQAPDLDGGVVSDFEDLPETSPTVAGRILRRNTGSISKVNTIITSVRSRSSTMASSLIAEENDPDKEVLLPAWMFLQLLPRYIDRSTGEKEKNCIRAKFSSDPENPEEPVSSSSDNDEHFEEAYFGRRPIIPIVLKRYMWDSESKPLKLQRKVDIPQTIESPVFLEHESLFEGFELTLQSFICHRGDSTESGHYIAAVPKTVPHDDTWLLFNDMDSKAKVKEMSFEEILKNETPYILFYRIERAQSEPAIRIEPPSGSKDRYWSENDSQSTFKKPPSEKPSSDNPPSEKPLSEKVLFEKPASDKLSELSEQPDMDQRRGSHSTAVSMANSLKQERRSSKHKKLHRMGLKSISRSTTKSGNNSTANVNKVEPEKNRGQHKKSRECIIA